MGVVVSCLSGASLAEPSGGAGRQVSVGLPSRQRGSDGGGCQLSERSESGGALGRSQQTIQLDVWSDIVCPWCYIGKRRLERGLAAAREIHPDLEVDLTYHAFQLDPRARVGEDRLVREVYERKFGGTERADQIIEHMTAEAAAEGLDFRLDIAKRSNTILGHRLLAFARQAGRQLDMKERLLHAYFTEGAAIGHLEVLVDLAEDIGLDGDRARTYLQGDGGEESVAADLRAAVDNDITAVPTFVFDRAYVVPGALDANAFTRVLSRLWQKR